MSPRSGVLAIFGSRFDYKLPLSLFGGAQQHIQSESAFSDFRPAHRERVREGARGDGGTRSMGILDAHKPCSNVLMQEIRTIQVTVVGMDTYEYNLRITYTCDTSKNHPYIANNTSQTHSKQ